MNEIILPPSPNWYLSNILACSYNGTVAWGARNTLFILTCNEDEKTTSHFMIRNVHKYRVTCVAFTPEFPDVNSNLLASTGDDNILKVWDIETLTTVYNYTFGTDKVAVATDWSHKTPYLLYAATSNGSVLSWNCYFNVFSSISLGKAAPTCVSACPHHPHLVAVGSKSGLVYIVNFEGKGSVVYRLRGHDTEVVSLSWCPSEQNVITGNQSADLLLASGGKDRAIYIWKAGEDGRYETSITLPQVPIVTYQHRSKLNVGSWITLRWLEPTVLFSSSSYGELLSWDISKINKIKPVCKLVHAHHIRGLFCIAHVPEKQQNVDNWRIRKRHKIWTVAQDRRVMCCTIQENNVEIEYNVHTQGGYVYCIAACPLETSRVAFGVGDAGIRLWNISEKDTNIYDITLLWQKIKGKIRALSWHPEKENLLAYATEEGRVGIFDTNGNKPPTLCRQYHRDVVYAIHWGPHPESKHHVLYTCAEGECVYYDPSKPNQEPKSMIKKDCTELSWKPDYSCLSIGFENGSISFFNRNLQQRGYAKFGAAMVHCLVWHPESTATDLTYSPMRNYMAIACKSCVIIILNVSNLMEQLNAEDSTENVDEQNRELYKVNEIVATLTGHVHSVVCLAWNPYITGQLISGSYDSTAQVWNVETQELIATYLNHAGPVLTCMWSPLSPDYVITGSLDFTLQVWKVTEHKAVTPQQSGQKFPVKKQKKKQTKANEITNASATNGVSESTSPLTEITSSLSECSLTNASQLPQKTKLLMMKEERKKKTERSSYFAKSTKTMNDRTSLLNSLIDVVKSAKRDEDVDDDEDYQHTSHHMTTLLFSPKDRFMSSFIDDKSSHVEKGRHDVVTEMDVWCDNLKQNLDDAAKENRLNDYLVSLSASLSMKTWKEMCELYAYQLINDGNIRKAVTYFLSIHKAYEAIDALLNANLHKEAYTLARYKVESDDPILTTILVQWAKYTVDTGRFEEAACIYAKLGNFTDTIKYLALRIDVSSIVTAAEIAYLCDNGVLSKSLAEEAMALAIKKAECTAIHDIIAKFPYLKYREIHLIVLEALRILNENNVGLQEIRMWLNGELDDDLSKHVLEITCRDYYCYYDDLRRGKICYILENKHTLWLNVSHDVALAMISPDKQQRMKHIVAAFGVVARFETLHSQNVENECSLLLKLILMLDSRNPNDTECMFAKADYPVSTSLRAYLCYALLNWCIKNIDRTVNLDIQIYISFIEGLFEDIMNKQIVRLWSLKGDIQKLEDKVQSILRKIQEGDPSATLVLHENIVQELNTLKAEKKELDETLVCAPDPSVVYSTALELGSKLSDESLKTRFLEMVESTWTKVRS